MSDVAAHRSPRIASAVAGRPLMYRSREAGLSLVEMLLALTIGLFIVMGAGALLLNQLDGNRRLLQGARVQQDLQLATDLMARSLRRRGYIDPMSANITEWRLSSGVIQMKWDNGNWQSVTEAETMVVSALEMKTTATETDLASVCPMPVACIAAGNCPKVVTTSIDVTVTARAVTEPRQQRQLRDTVYLRNPAVTGSCS